MNAEDMFDHGAVLQETLRHLESWQTQDPNLGQRRFRRYSVRGLARLHADSPLASGSAQATPVHVRDISRGGMGVLSNQSATNGQQWQVQITDDRVTLATLTGFCRFCREVGPGVHLIGIEFGAQASVLLAMGVSANDLALGDGNENATSFTDLSSGEFVDPASLAA